MKNTTQKILRKIFVILMVIMFVAPFYIAFVYSFKTKQEVAMGKLSFPTHLYIDNFIEVIKENPMFMTGLRNSIISTIPVVIILTIVCSMAAYVLARNTNRFYSFLYYAFLTAILIPYQGIMFPIYLNFRTIGLTNSLLGYIIARVGYQIPISILILTGFIKGIPISLEESAQIDGANTLTTFWRIVFPLMKPVNTTIIVINSVFSWNDFNIAVSLLSKKLVRTLPLAQFYYFGENTMDLNLAFAFFTLSMIPIIVLYWLCQKYIVSGIVTGAVKG